MQSPSSEKPIVVANFSDGYSLRNVLAFVRQTCTRANLIFTKDSITIKEADATDTILAHCEIYADDLTEYQYNFCDDQGNPIEAMACGFMTVDMQKATKMVGKKDAIKISTIREKNPKIYVQVTHAGSKSDSNLGLRIVPTLDVEVHDFKEIPYKRTSPNARAPSTEFAKVCTDFSSLKCTYTDIIGFDNGIMFQGVESGTIKSIETYGKVNKFKPHNIISASTKYSLSPANPGANAPKLHVSMKGEVSRVRINGKTIRAMCKFNNLSPTGVIKFFLEDGNPLKIVSPVGCYGRLTLYIKDMGIE